MRYQAALNLSSPIYKMGIIRVLTPVGYMRVKYNVWLGSLLDATVL